MVNKRFQAAPLTKTSGHGNPGTTVTIHETANTAKGAGAATHANLQSRGNVRQASWHWSVDDKEAVQSFHHNIQCWHSGKAAGNNTSIAIEICVNSDSDFDVAVENACQLAADILREKGLGSGALRQHHDWSGKDCPNFLREGSKGPSWENVVNRVAELLAPSPANNPKPPAPAPPKPSKPKQLTVDGLWGEATTRRLQQYFGTPVDGVISHQWKSSSNQHLLSAQWDRTQSGSTVIRAIQQHKLHVAADGLLGTKSIYALQRYLGTPQDGVISKPSEMVAQMQRRLNANNF